MNLPGPGTPHWPAYNIAMRKRKNEKQNSRKKFHTYYEQPKGTAKYSEPQSKSLSLSYTFACTVKLIMTLLSFIPEDFIQEDRDAPFFFFF